VSWESIGSARVPAVNGVECPVCGSTVPMRAEQTGGYGSKPNWVFTDHEGTDGEMCAASGRTATDAAG
jgi:hypothetical protein